MRPLPTSGLSCQHLLKDCSADSKDRFKDCFLYLRQLFKDSLRGVRGLSEDCSAPFGIGRGPFFSEGIGQYFHSF